MMKDKLEEETYSAFLFLIGEQGRKIVNTMEWEKIQDADGNPTEEDYITINELFKTFDQYCEPRNNLVVERRTFFWRNQYEDEHFDQYLTELNNLASTCEFGELHDDLLPYKIVDGIQLDKIRDTLLRKGMGMTLEKAIETNRTEEVTRRQMQLLKNEKEVDYINKQSRKQLSKRQSQEPRKTKMIRCQQVIYSTTNVHTAESNRSREIVQLMAKFVENARRRITGHHVVGQKQYMTQQKKTMMMMMVMIS